MATGHEEPGGERVSDSIICYLHQASQYLVEDGYDKHEHPILAIDEAAVELARLLKLVEAQREAIREMFAWYEEDRGEDLDAPGHSHQIPGIWDESDCDELAGKPCEWCAIWRRLKSTLELK
jgi:hypothetical protein